MARQYGNYLPPGLYTGGAVSFDSSPFTNQYLAQIAHQRAQQDATMKYFGELGGRLTPQGMVDEDVQDLIKMKNDWQSFNIANRDKLANLRMDNGNAYMQSMQKFNQMQDLIQKSKYKSDFANRYVKPIVDNPQKYALLSDESKNMIQRAGLPVSDPDYTPMRPEDLTFKAKPFDGNDVGKLQRAISQFKGNLSYDQPVQDKTTGTQTVTGHRSFSKDDLNGMATIAGLTYEGHPGFQKEINDIYDNPGSDEFQKYNALYKQHYGQDIQSPHDLAAAYALGVNPNPLTVTSKPSRMTVNPITMEGIKQAGRKSLIDYRNQNKVISSQDADKVASQDVENLYQKAKQTAQGDPTATSYVAPVGPDLLNSYSRLGSNGKKTTPTELHFSPDGSQVTPIFKDATGNTDNNLSQPISRDQFQRDYKDHYWGKKSPTVTTTTTQTEIDASKLSSDPKDWKKVGSNYQYKDGSVWDATGKKIK